MEMSNRISLVVLGIALVLPGAGRQSCGVKQVGENNATSAIALLTKTGVDVRINQIQLQRIGTSIDPVAAIGKFGIDLENFSRTIAISISQKGQGTSSGPISIILKNGVEMHPMLQGNQKLMSVLVNSKIDEDYDFMESWFAVPSDIEFEQIFPISVSFHSTDLNEVPVDFIFEDITP
jgi:hypothetical protein